MQARSIRTVIRPIDLPRTFPYLTTHPTYLKIAPRPKYTTSMAPKIFDKVFKREHKIRDYCFRPREFRPDAIGISDSTCEIKGDLFNGWKLPVLAPEQNALKPHSRQRVAQQASWFFRLSVEIRRIIYIELMGNRRVHIEYSQMLQSPFQPKSKRGGKRQDWWYSVCQNSNSFVRDTYDDRCRDRGDERYTNQFEGLTSTLLGTKLRGVEWLRCCQIGQVFCLLEVA